MKWGHISDTLAVQLEKIERIGFDAFPPCLNKDEFVNMLRRESNATANETYDAIEFFVRTGHWPEMSAKTKFFIHARIHFGWKTTASLSVPLLGQPIPTFNADLEHHLMWALITIWDTFGFECWLIDMGDIFSEILSIKLEV